jgi:transcriptional regulator GlxA family with amidase domain
LEKEPDGWLDIGSHFGVPAKRRIKPPSDGLIKTAFVISNGLELIDYAGPWQVFNDTRATAQAEESPFELYSVAEDLKPIKGSGGTLLLPHYTFETAPPPNVIVVPAQGGRSPKMLDWIRSGAAHSDVTMSVCTGAFILAAAGLLDGLRATTHHEYLARLRERPEVKVQSGVRFVDEGRILTSAGLTSGIDSALWVVVRYFGPKVARRTAKWMEYEGLWST